MYKVTMVYGDSSVESHLVKAETKARALNAILNRTMSCKQPKFVIFEEFTIEENDTDLNLVSNFKETPLTDGNSIYTFENKLCKTVNIDSVSYRIGGFQDKSLISELLDTNNE